MEQNSSAHALEYAGFWRRLVAFVVDAMLLSVIICIMFTFNNAILLNFESQRHFIPLVAINNILSVLATLAYSIIFWYRRGQTPGNILLNIKVLRGDGSHISFGCALLRYLGCVICILTLGIGFLWISFDSRKQGFHDKIAHTVVVKLPEPAHADTAIQTASQCRIK